MTDADTTDVIFKLEGRDVVAFFPGIPGASPNDVSCFAHVGQHSGASVAYLAQCRPATAEQYQDLKAELEAAPYHYRLRVVRRATTGHRRQRYETCH